MSAIDRMLRWCCGLAHDPAAFTEERLRRADGAHAHTAGRAISAAFDQAQRAEDVRLTVAAALERMEARRARPCS